MISINQYVKIKEKFKKIYFISLQDLLLLGLINFISQNSCGIKEKNKESSEEREKIVIAMEDGPTNLYPPLANSAYSFRVVELIHRALFKFDKNLNIIPDLAEKIDIQKTRGNDGEEIILKIKIREGEKTCSGKKINSSLVAKSLKKYIERGKFRYIKSIRETSENEIELISEPYASIMYDLTSPIFPEDNFTDCTGEFKLVEFEPGKKAVLQKRNGKKKVVIKGIENDITRVLELEKGDVDIIVNAVPPNLIEYIKKLKNVQVIERSGINISYIGLNLRNKYLADKRVRKAIAYAIPKEEIIKNLLEDYAEPINSMLPKSSVFYFEHHQYPYSPQTAKKLLEEAGFFSEQKIPVFIWKTSNVKYAIRNVKAIASALEKIGMKIDIQTREFSTFFYEVINGNFDMYSLNFVGVKDPEILRYIAHSKMIPPYGANRAMFSNPIFDAIVEKASSEMNERKRKTLLEQAQKILQDELPYIPLWQVKDIIVFRKNKVKHIDESDIIPGGSLTFLSKIIE
jgi:ABC-type transport system substrate-binding protein